MYKLKLCVVQSSIFNLGLVIGLSFLRIYYLLNAFSLMIFVACAVENFIGVG